MKIKNKLILVSLIPISLLGIISIAAVFWSNRLFSEFINEDVIKQSIVQGIDASEKDLGRNANLYLFIQDPKEKKLFDEDSNQINEYFTQYNKLPLSKEESAILAKVRLLINQGIVLKDDEFKIADENIENSNEFEDLLNVKIKPLLTQWTNKLNSLDTQSVKERDILQDLTLTVDNAISESRAYSLFSKDVNKKNTQMDLNLLTDQLIELYCWFLLI